METGDGNGVSGPKPSPSPSLKILKRAHAKGDAVTIVLGCTGATCKGSVSELSTEQLRGSKIIAVTAGAKAYKKTVTVGSKRFTIAAGHDATLMLTLGSAGRKLIARFHRLRVLVEVTLKGTSANSATVGSSSLTLKLPPKRR